MSKLFVEMNYEKAIPILRVPRQCVVA